MALAPATAAAQAVNKLTEFDYLLLGLSIRPEPEVQVVPRNTPTGLHVAVGFSNFPGNQEILLQLLPPDLEVVAELVGPGISPTELRGRPGELLPIPPLVQSGIFVVRDIRLERGGEMFLRASPDTATVEVIDRVLITQVTTRPLTLEEIRQKGILFGDDSFTGYNFTLALSLDSRPVTVDLPVVFDSQNVPIPFRPTSSIDITGPGLPIVANTRLVPVMMAPDLPQIEQEIQRQLPSDIGIRGLLVIPGDVGFLNQFFSALLLVTNVAPADSGLSVRGLTGTIELPVGQDQVPGNDDDPLVLAETTEGGNTPTQSVLGLGPDGLAGTADDTNLIEPGEQGQSEFLLEGKLEGFHEISFDIQGMLEGLPVGPVPIRGIARGGVLVRNPEFQLTFTMPATVRFGEEFSLYVAVTNISSSIANAVTVRPGPVSGAIPKAGEPEFQTVDTLLPGESEVFRFRFNSLETGQVTASYLRVDQGTGNLLFELGVSERGVPLSPDTILLPESVNALKPDGDDRSEVAEAAVRVLGLAWSNATAPNGLLPEGVTRLSKSAVLDRATELAEAGFRVQLGESLDQALIGLALSWLGARDAGFEEILRQTNAGASFLAAIGRTLSRLPNAPGNAFELQNRMAPFFTSRPPYLIVGIGEEGVEPPVGWRVVSGGASVEPGDGSNLRNGAFLPLFPEEASGLVLVPRLAGGFYELELEGLEDGVFDISLSVPQQDGSTGLYLFENVEIQPGVTGRLTIDLLRDLSTLSLDLENDPPQTLVANVDAVSSRGPRLLAATAIGPETLTGADPWGRVLALLFDRELREQEANFAENYRVEANQILSAVRQLSGRVVFLFLRDPVADLVPRNVNVTGLSDTTGRRMSPATVPIGSNLADPGAIVSGRVLSADGTPLTRAQILYTNSTFGGRIGVSAKQVERDGSYSFDYVRQSPYGPFSIRATDPETGGIQELSTRVRENGDHVKIDLVLLGRGGVRGVVTDLSQDRIAGARVLVTSQVDPANAVLTETNGNGEYEATGLIVGPIQVKAVFETFSGIESGNIPRAGTVTTVDVELNKGSGRVSGGVFDPGTDPPTPLPGVAVYYLIPRPGGAIVAASTETDDDGLYTFEEMPAGEFQILALDLVTGRRETSPRQTLLADDDLTNIDLFFSSSVEAFGSIRGKVLDADGQVIEGALVQAAGRQVLTVLQPDSQEIEFLIENVPEGTHGVTARVSGFTRNASATAKVVAGEITTVNLTLPGAGEIRVTVLDVNGVAIPNQQVIRLTGQSACSGEAQTTDGLGVAVFPDVPVGGSLFKVTRGSDIAKGSAVVERNNQSVGLTLRFSGFGTVKGKVLDANGPYMGADVVLGALRLDNVTCSFVKDSRARQVRSDSEGNFIFENVPVGPVTVSASQPAFFPTPATAKGALISNGDVEEFELLLTDRMGGQLTGTVFLPDGETPAGAGVAVSTSSPSGADITIITNEDGRYEFAKILPPGRYTLTASDLLTGGQAQRNVQLLEEQDVVADLRLLGQNTVEVTVLDGAGDLIEEAFVTLKRTSFPFDEAVGEIVAGDNGVIRFQRISEGAFAVTASASQGRGGRANGSVSGDGSTAKVTVNLTVTGTVVGVYRAADGQEPIPNAEVRLKQGTTGRVLGSSLTSAIPTTLAECGFEPNLLGTFQFDYVPAGTVLATATDPLTGRIGEASGRIETEDEVVCLEIIQLGAGRISGRVVRLLSGDVEEPIAAATVELTSTTGLATSSANLRATATTGGGGEFEFDGVPVGSFVLKATFPGLLLTGTASGVIERDGQELTDVVIPLDPSGSISGTVFRADGTTLVPGAAVTLRPRLGSLRMNADVNGDFTFDFVPAGDFSLRAEDSESGDAGVRDGTLEEAQVLEGIDIQFNGLGTVLGTALDSDGLPLSSGTVHLRADPPFARSETATVDETGQFRFLRVPVGEYSLSLSVTGSPLKGTATGTVEFDTHTDEIEIQLADSRTLTGKVLRADGETAAANARVSVKGSGFNLSELADTDGVFSIHGVPLDKSFTFRAEDSITEGIAILTRTLTAADPKPVDLGSIVLDDSPIEVESFSPSGTAPPDSPIQVRFTDPAVLSSIRFEVSDSNGTLPGFSRSLSADGLTLTLTRFAHLPPRSEINVVILEGLRDTLGRISDQTFATTFSTSGTVVTGTVTGTVPLQEVEVKLLSGTTTRTTMADSSGAYRIEDAPAGIATVQALHPPSGQARSTVIDIGTADARLTANLALAPAGSLSGQVRNANGFPEDGVLVEVRQGGVRYYATTSGPDGAYSASGLPLQSLIVEASRPNGDRGQTSVVLTEADPVASNVDVDLLGVGSVRVQVVDSEGGLVDDPTVELTYRRFNQFIRDTNPVLDGNDFVFSPVLSGPVTAKAVADGLEGSTDGEVVADVEVTLVVHIEAAGAIFGKVLAPDGASEVEGAQVKLFRANGAFAGEQFTTAEGFRFEPLPVADGPYRLDVLDSGKLRARRSAVDVPSAGETEVNIRLLGLATVTGTVVAEPGRELSSSVEVTLTSLSSIGGRFSDPNAADGTYTLTDVPEGAFVIEAIDDINILRGEAEGVVQEDGETVVVPELELEANDLDLRGGRTLADANGANYFVTKSGSLRNGLDDMFLAAFERDGLHLEVTVESQTTRFAGQDFGSQEEAGREIATGTEEIGGLRIRRKIYVPQDGYFARYLEIFENRAGEPVSFSATVVSNLNNASTEPRVVATSRDDDQLEASWLVTDDEADLDPFEAFSLPSTAWVLAGTTSAPPDFVDFEEIPASVPEGRLTVRYGLNLGVGERAILMHFVSQELFRDSATEAAERLSAPTEEALVGLSAGEIADIVNFDLAGGPSDAFPPLPQLNGTVVGTLRAPDQTPIGTEVTIEVRFQSDHILFPRTHKVRNQPGGRFGFRSQLGVTGFNVVAIPRTGFTLNASPLSTYLSSATATAVSDFAQGTRAVTNLSLSPLIRPSASSIYSATFAAEKAFDGNPSTRWLSVTGDVARLGKTPTLEAELPDGLTLHEVFLDTVVQGNSEMFRARIELIGGDSFGIDVDLPEPDRDYRQVVDPPRVGDRQVRVISLDDRGGFVGFWELELIGSADYDIGLVDQDLVFSGTSAIEGTTRMADGDPAASRVEIISRSRFLGRVDTDDEGHYFFAPIPPDASPLEVRARVIENQLLVATEQALLSPDVTTEVNLTYPPSSVVTGRVLTASSEPVENVTVTLTPGALRSTTAISGNPEGIPPGTYRIEGVPTGAYTLEVSLQNGRTVKETLTVNGLDPETAQDIVVPRFGSVELTVVFESRITGTEPVKYASVQRRDQLDTSFRTVGRTDANGKFLMDNITEGPFTLKIFHPRTALVFVEVNETLDPDIQPQPLPILVTHIALGKVNGLAQFADDSPATAAPVQIFGDGVTTKTSVTSANPISLGQYTFFDVEAVRPFTVRVRHPQRQDIFKDEAGEIPADNQTVTVNVKLPKVGPVEVTVQEQTGDPIPSARIWVSDPFSGGFYYRGFTASNGKLLIPWIPEGPFTVRATLGSETLGEESGIVSPDPLDVDPVPILIVRPARVTVEGRVVAGDGLTPVSGARVELRSEDGSSLLAADNTDADGRYLFEEQLSGGQAALVRASFSGAQADESVPAGNPGDTLQVDIQLDLSVLKGRILEADNSTPVSGATVELRRGGSFSVRTTFSSEDGEFVYLGEPEDVYELSAQDSFGLVGYARVELLPGESVVEQDVLLPEFGAVEVTVVDSAGNPLTDELVILTNANLLVPRSSSSEEIGVYIFDRVALGSFTVTYDRFSGDVPISGAASGRLSSSGERATVQIELPAVAPVFGFLLDSAGQQTTPSDEFTRLDIESRKHESGSGILRQLNEVSVDGDYRVEDVPVGEVTLTADDVGEAATGSGVVVEGAETQIDVQLGGPAVKTPVELAFGVFDSEELSSRGSLQFAFIESVPEHGLSSVNRKPYPLLASATTELSGQQFVFGPIQTSGILHTRKVFFPAGQSVVRYLEIFENTHDFDVELTVEIHGREFFIETTSSGDGEADLSDRYLVGSSGPAVVFAGNQSPITAPDALRVDFTYEIEWRRLAIPKGGRVILMHFMVVTDNFAEAVAEADSLIDLSNAGALSGLTVEERAEIVNFKLP